MAIGRRDFLKTAGAGLAFMGMSGLLAACARPSAAPTATAPGAPAAVKLGILTDLTGPYAAVGKSLLNNIQLAKDEIDAGHVGSFDLIVEDMATDPKTSVEKATKLVQSDKVAAIVGVISSAAREAVRPVIADRGKLPFIYTTGYEGGDCNANLWCAGPVPPQEVNPYVEWLMATHGKSIFFFGADYVWPHSMFAQTRQLWEAAGGSVAGEDYAPLDASDFTTLVTHVKATQPNIVLSAFPTPAWTNAVQQLTDAGTRDKTHISTYFMSDWFAEAIPAGIRDGISTINNYFYDVPGDANEKYLSTYRKKFGEGEPTDGVGLGGYWSLHLYAQALKAVGSTAADSIRPALSAASFPGGPTGDVTFGADHHLTQNVYLAVTKGGKFKIEKTFANAAPAQSCKFA